MVNYWDNLINEIGSKNPDPKVIENLKANLMYTCCPHMFFQDIDREEENVHCKAEGQNDCHKCWTGTKESIPRVKKEKESKNPVKESKKLDEVDDKLAEKRREAKARREARKKRMLGGDK